MITRVLVAGSDETKHGDFYNGASLTLQSVNICILNMDV